MNKKIQRNGRYIGEEVKNGPCVEVRINKYFSTIEECHNIIEEIRGKTSMMQVSGRGLPTPTETQVESPLESMLAGLKADLLSLLASYTD